MSRKFLFGFALLVCVALVGVVVDSNPTTYADDSEKAAPGGTGDNANPATDDEKKPVVAEAPLSPEDDYPVRVTYDIMDGGPCVTIDVINNGATQMMIVFGEWKQAVSFRLRADKEPFAEEGATWAEFSGNPHKLCNNAFTSAVIICPDEECLKAWEDWFPKACQEAWDRAHPNLQPARIFPDGPHESK